MFSCFLSDNHIIALWMFPNSQNILTFKTAFYLFRQQFLANVEHKKHSPSLKHCGKNQVPSRPIAAFLLCLHSLSVALDILLMKK